MLKIPIIIKQILILLATFVVLFFLMLNSMSLERYDLKVGDICPVDIFAQREVVDKLTTEKNRDAQENNVSTVYRIDSEPTKAGEQQLSALFAEIKSLRDGLSSAVEFAEKHDFSVDIVTFAQGMSIERYNEFQAQVTQIAADLIATGIEDTNDIPDMLHTTDYLVLGSNEKKLALALLSNAIVKNKFVDENATELERQRARAMVQEVVYKVNQKIVGHGEVIQPEHFQLLLDLGLVEGTGVIDVRNSVGVAALLFGILSILFVYMRLYAPYVANNSRHFLMVCIVLMLSLSIAVVMGRYFDDYLIPLAFGGTLLSVLLKARLGVMINILICLLMAIMINQEAVYICGQVVVSIAVALLFSRAMGRRAMVMMTAISVVIAFFVICTTSLLITSEMPQAVKNGLQAMISTLISTVLVLGTSPAFEFLFDILTPLRLLELANPKQKLLNQLLREASGTYHHSLMVGNLAEAAAEAVGANALLSRVGAYYHDVGKLKEPLYFKENQFLENIHDRLAPQLSAQIIIAHVRQGVELGKQHRLPSDILDIIAQHHGTTTAWFFLNKAKEIAPDKVSDLDYKYPGPRPNTREAAIVMLADSVEAAVRTLQEKTTESMFNMIKRIVNDKLRDGQLNDCALTLKDLDSIVQAFINVFSGYFHQRIEYK